MEMCKRININLYINVSTTDNNYLLLFSFTAGAILSSVVTFSLVVFPFRVMLTTGGRQTNVNDKRRTKSEDSRTNPGATDDDDDE